VSFTFVQSHAFGTQTATTTTYAFPANVTSGDLLVWSGYFTSASSRTISSISDTLGNTWVVGFGSQLGSIGVPAIYCLKSVGSGANTVSITWNASVTIQHAWVGEFTAPSGTTFDASTAQSVTQQPCGACDDFGTPNSGAGELVVGWNNCFSNCDNPYIDGAPATWTIANTASSNCFTYTLSTDSTQSANVDAASECGCFAYDYAFVFLAFLAPGGTPVTFTSSIGGHATVTDSLSVKRSFADAAKGQATMTDTMAVKRAFVDSILGQASMVDSMAVKRALADAVLGHAVVQDNLGVKRAFAEAMLGQATMADSMAVKRAFMDTIVVHATMSESLSIYVYLAMAALGRAGVGASLERAVGLGLVAQGHAHLAEQIAVARQFGLTIEGHVLLEALWGTTTPTIYSPLARGTLWGSAVVQGTVTLSPMAQAALWSSSVATGAVIPSPVAQGTVVLSPLMTGHVRGKLLPS
jgi:hypothetical protein